MASIIRIKRSSVSGNPATLAAGELAYSALTDNGSNGGDRLYIGIGTETSGNAANHLVIGGKYFTDMLDHTPGVLTASSALVVDSSKKLDELLVDSLSLNDNTLSATGTLKLQAGTGNIIELAANNYISGGAFGGSQLILGDSAAAVKQLRGGDVSLTVGAAGTATSSLVFNNDGSLTVPGTIKTLSNGDLTLSPNGTGKTVIVNPYIGDTSTSLAEYIYDTVGGAVTGTAGQITITNSDAGNTSTIALASGVATAGTYGSGTAVPSITIDTYGRVTGITTNSISSSFTLGSTSISLGSTTTTIAGLSSVTSTTFVGALTGNASTATTLATARNINGVSFNGSADITVTAAAGTLTGSTLNSSVTASSLTSVGTIATGVWNGTAIAVGYGGTGTNNGSITGTGALTFTAAAGNNNVNLVPTGTGIVDVGGKRVGNAATPTQSTDLTTKAYVDSLSNGLDVKASVRAATTANITLSNTQTVDGVSLSVGDRVLVKDQSTGSENGIYVVASGAWTRATDFDNSPDIEVSPGTFFFVEEGTTQADNGYVVSNNGAITIGTTAITFSQFSGAGQITAGAGLTKTGNTLDVVGTTNRISVATDSIDISTSYVGQTSITTLGTIGTGTWQGTLIGATYGGTGVNNGSNTLTLAGNVSHAGAYTQTFTATANTSLTLPTTGTLATLAGSESLSNKTITASSFSGTTLGASGAVTFTSTTDASAIGTAAVVLSGGLSVAKAMYIGTNITGAGAGTSTLDGFNIDGGTY